MKRTLLICLISVFIVALLILNQNQLVALTGFFSFGQDIKQDMSNNSAETIVFTVNGYAVTQSHINNQKTAAQYQGITINDEQAYNKIIGNVLLAQEAEKRGFIVREEDAKEFAQENEGSYIG